MTISMDGHGPAALQVTPELSPTGVCLRLAGEMDVATAGRLAEIMRALPIDHLREVRLDLADLAFIDASGLTALLEARTLVRSDGGRLSLRGSRPMLLQLLEITDLTSMFDTEPESVQPNNR